MKIKTNNCLAPHILTNVFLIMLLKIDGMIFNSEKNGIKAGKIDYNMVTTKNSTVLLMPYIDFICFFEKKNENEQIEMK